MEERFDRWLASADDGALSAELASMTPGQREKASERLRDASPARPEWLRHEVGAAMAAQACDAAVLRVEVEAREEWVLTRTLEKRREEAERLIRRASTMSMVSEYWESGDSSSSDEAPDIWMMDKRQAKRMPSPKKLQKLVSKGSLPDVSRTEEEECEDYYSEATQDLEDLADRVELEAEQVLLAQGVAKPGRRVLQPSQPWPLHGHAWEPAVDPAAAAGVLEEVVVGFVQQQHTQPAATTAAAAAGPDDRLGDSIELVGSPTGAQYGTWEDQVGAVGFKAPKQRAYCAVTGGLEVDSRARTLDIRRGRRRIESRWFDGLDTQLRLESTPYDYMAQRFPSVSSEEPVFSLLIQWLKRPLAYGWEYYIEKTTERLFFLNRSRGVASVNHPDHNVMLALLSFSDEMREADPDERIAIMAKALEGQKRNLQEHLANWSGPHAHRGEKIWYDEKNGVAVTRDPHADVRRKHRKLVQAMQSVGARLGMQRKDVEIAPMTPRKAKPAKAVEPPPAVEQSFIPVEDKPTYVKPPKEPKRVNEAYAEMGRIKSGINSHAFWHEGARSSSKWSLELGHKRPKPQRRTQSLTDLRGSSQARAPAAAPAIALKRCVTAEPGDRGSLPALPAAVVERPPGESPRLPASVLSSPLESPRLVLTPRKEGALRRSFRMQQERGSFERKAKGGLGLGAGESEQSLGSLRSSRSATAGAALFFTAERGESPGPAAWAQYAKLQRSHHVRTIRALKSSKLAQQAGYREVAAQSLRDLHAAQARLAICA